MFKIEYTKCEAGWIDFTVSNGETKLEYCFTEVWNSPKDLLDWAEKIYNGDNSEYANDSEGWCWYFDYDGKNLTISDTQNFNDENPEYKKYPRFSLEISKDELCKEIYRSIKAFQKSGLYIPREWEPLYFKQILEKYYGLTENAIEIISDMKIEEIIAELRGKSDWNNGEAEFYIMGFFDESENQLYNSTNKTQRKEIINEYIEDNSNYAGYDGYPVMKIKSDLFEKSFLFCLSMNS